jgi:hypothetical protein
MTRQPLLVALVAVAVVLGTFTAAHAEKYRVSWRHPDGHFENVNGTKWVEQSPDGTFRFEEQKRGDDFVQLYDASRDCHVRLYGDRCMVKFGDGRYQEYYRGHWANK